MNKIFFNYMFMLFLLCQICIVQGTSFHAVCVGISDYPEYPNPGLDLPEDCVNDATDMRDYLVDYQGWSSGNIDVLLDSDATENDIDAAIGNMPNSTGNSELFHYSGHGNTSGLYTYSGTITPSELQGNFSSSNYQYCTFLDACRSGVFVNYMSRGEISSACKSNESAYCGGPDDNSIYSYYVLEGIKNDQADPAAGHVVSAKEVHTYAASRTTNYAYSTYGKDMHPKFKGNLGVLNLHSLGPTTSGTLIDHELWDQNVTLTGNVTVPDGKTLVVYNSSVNLGNYYLRCLGSGQIIKKGSASIPSNILVKSGTDIKAYASTIQSAVDIAVSGQDVIVSSGTFAGAFNMKSGVDVIGAGATSTYVGQANFSSDTNCELKNLNSSDLNISGGNYTTKVTNFRTNYKIEITGGNAWLENVEFLQGDYNCGIDVNGGYPSLVDITSTTSRSDPGDPAVYIHNSGSPSIDVGSIQYKNRGIQLGDYCYATTYADFCHNTWDMYASSGAYLRNI